MRAGFLPVPFERKIMTTAIDTEKIYVLRHRFLVAVARAEGASESGKKGDSGNDVVHTELQAAVSAHLLRAALVLLDGVDRARMLLDAVEGKPQTSEGTEFPLLTFRLAGIRAIREQMPQYVEYTLPHLETLLSSARVAVACPPEDETLDSALVVESYHLRTLAYMQKMDLYVRLLSGDVDEAGSNAVALWLMDEAFEIADEWQTQPVYDQTQSAVRRSLSRTLSCALPGDQAQRVDAATIKKLVPIARELFDRANKFACRGGN